MLSENRNLRAWEYDFSFKKKSALCPIRIVMAQNEHNEIVRSSIEMITSHFTIWTAKQKLWKLSVFHTGKTDRAQSLEMAVVGGVETTWH